MILEKLLHIYHRFLKNNSENQKKAKLKKISVRFAFFIAKRRGVLPVFFTKKEEQFLRLWRKESPNGQTDENFKKKLTDGIQQSLFDLEIAPLVSIIIPTKDNVHKLNNCIKSIKDSTYKNLEIIIVTNSRNKETLNFFEKLNYKTLRYDEPFNYSKMNNFAVKHAIGEYFLFLNDDVEAITANWLESMMSYAMHDNVGVVGSLLLFPKSPFYESTIQHAGILIGVGGPATHAFSFSHYDKPQYQNLHKISRKVGAVTGACMLIKRIVFTEVGGFDEKFTVVFGDVDICLRIRQKGYDIVYDADAKLYHHESSSRGLIHPVDDEILFLKRWEESILKGDDCYDQGRSMIHRDFCPSPFPTNIPAITLILEIYFFREDLQKRFRGVNNENYQSLIDWAATEGITKDIARSLLLPYNRFYKDNSSEKVRKLANEIYQFNFDLKKRSMFPEVLEGKYQRLMQLH